MTIDYMKLRKISNDDLENYSKLERTLIDTARKLDKQARQIYFQVENLRYQREWESGAEERARRAAEYFADNPHPFSPGGVKAAMEAWDKKIRPE